MAGRTGEAFPTPAPLPDVPEVAEFSFAASARKLDPIATKGEEALGPEPERHREAWAAYDEVPEVGQMVSASAGLLSQCRLYPGYVDATGAEHSLTDDKGQPVEGFSPQFVADCAGVLGRYVDEGGSQRGLIARQAENFHVTGDAYMVVWPIGEDGKPWAGPSTAAGNAPSGERVEVVSRGAVGKAQGRWTIQLGGDRATRLPAEAICYRMWRKHPRRPDDSRGWVVQALDAIRDLRVFSLATRSAARSNIPSGILVVAQEASPRNVIPGGAPAGGSVPSPIPAGAMGGLALPAGGGATAGPGTPVAQPTTWAQQLERLIGDAVMEVLRDAQSGRAVVPAVLSISEKYVDKFHELSLSREIDGVLPQLVQDARTRIAEGADCPPEMLRGLGETNRWNGAQIADDEYRRYFRPLAMAIADAWTTELLWEGLRALGHPEEMIRRARVLVDSRGVVAEPDKGKTAGEGVKLGAVGLAPWRAANGFTEADAPTPEELDLIRSLVGRPQGQPMGDQPGDVNRQVGSAQVLGEREPDPATPGRATTATIEPLPAPRLPELGKLRTRTTASIAQPLSGDELAAQLLTIEQTARTRLEEACEAALDQALARAGAKFRSWGRTDHDLRGLLAQTDARDVPALLGPDRSRRLVADRFADDQARREDLFAAALAALLGAFGRIGQAAYERALRVLRVAIVQPGDDLPGWAVASFPAEEVARNLATGEQVLRASMLDFADRQVFDPIAAPEVGELSSLRVPSPVVRRTLAAAGGGQVEPGLAATTEAAPGLVFGPALQRFEPDRLGFTWVYGDEPRVRPYEPHLSIDGETFTGPDDPGLAGLAPDGGAGFPGDHLGCRCDWQPVFADGGE